MNFEIHTASINPLERPIAELSSDEVEEASSTFYVKSQRPAAIAAAHVATLVKSPTAYVRGFFGALRLTDGGLRKKLLAIAYFVEAVLVGRWMMDRRLSHLHVHFATPACTVGLIASKIFPIEFSFTVHGPDEFYDVHRYRLAEKIAVASFVCCIGHFARSQLMRLSPPEHWGKFEVAPLGVDPDVFRPVANRQPSDRFEILCVGRLVPAKGQHILIAAVAELMKTNREISLRFVGGGPDQENLKREVVSRGLGHRVHFEGPVNQDRIRDFYRRADVFVLPSFAEGIPVALMEAMAMEIPCVSTFVAGIPELIRNDIDGILVAPSDKHALAIAIRSLLVDPALRHRLGRSGRRRVIEKYNLERNVAHLAAILVDRIEGSTENTAHWEESSSEPTERDRSLA